jgi:pyruvate dehydrogenase E2 component (dihydrolipoamide acetyltransferase)
MSILLSISSVKTDYLPSLAFKRLFGYNRRVLKIVRLPLMGQTMEDGVILRWLKQEGDYVRKGEMLFEVLTDKANIEVDCTEEGYLRRWLVPLETSIPINTPVAVLSDDPNEPLDETNMLVPTPSLSPSHTSPLSHSSTPLLSPPAHADERIFITPKARMIAKEHGIPLQTLTGRGTGKGGRIQEADVQAYLLEQKAPILEAIVPEPLPTTVQPLSPMRRLTAEAVTRSYREAPHVTLFTEADAENLVDMRTRMLSQIAQTNGLKLSFNDLFIKAVALALRDDPRINMRWMGSGIEQNEEINIGFAVALKDALSVPVVHHADGKGLVEIVQTTHDLTQRARAGKLRPEDLQGGTFSISNLGTFGIDGFTPILTPGQSGILGIGQIVQKPAVRDGQLCVRHRVTLSLSFDHRAIDGAPAAQFLQNVKALVEEPFRWVL